MHTYRFSSTPAISSHFPQLFFTFRDGDQDDTPYTQLNARIRSGDYFEMLATRLDEFSERTRLQESSLSQELSLLSGELLYLQKNYSITKKDSME